MCVIREVNIERKSPPLLPDFLKRAIVRVMECGYKQGRKRPVKKGKTKTKICCFQTMTQNKMDDLCVHFLPL